MFSTPKSFVGMPGTRTQTVQITNILVFALSRKHDAKLLHRLIRISTFLSGLHSPPSMPDDHVLLYIREVSLLPHVSMSEVENSYHCFLLFWTLLYTDKVAQFHTPFPHPFHNEGNLPRRRLAHQRMGSWSVRFNGHDFPTLE